MYDFFLFSVHFSAKFLGIFSPYSCLPQSPAEGGLAGGLEIIAYAQLQLAEFQGGA